MLQPSCFDIAPMGGPLHRQPCRRPVKCSAARKTNYYNRIVCTRRHTKLQAQRDALHAGPFRNPANSIPARIVGLQFWTVMVVVRMRDIDGGGGACETFYNGRQGLRCMYVR